MKILKRILIVLVALIALVLIIALFVDKDYHAETQVTINKPKQQVFDYIKYLRNQDNFSVWARMDPNMKKEYRGTDGTVGFVSAWDGDEVGAGEQEITGIREGDRVDYELRFKRPFESTAAAYMATEASGDQTVVKWGLNGSSPYPFNVTNLFMTGMLEKDLKMGLDTLKSVLEK